MTNDLIERAGPALLRTRHDEATTHDDLKAPLNRALAIADFAAQALDNAAHHGDDLSLRSLEGVLGAIVAELSDLGVLIDHLEIDREGAE